jgi:hypothetical protein
LVISTVVRIEMKLLMSGVAGTEVSGEDIA